MKFIKNGFTVIGALSVVVILWGLYTIEPAYHRFNSFDEKALDTYQLVVGKLLNSGDIAEATTIKIQVDEGLNVSDVEKTMKAVAVKHNINNISEFSLYKKDENDIKNPSRFIKTYIFCNPLTAAKIMRYSDALSSYLPCKVTLLEDMTGNLWLYSLNMDLIIHGGRPLPDEFKREIISTKKVIREIMEQGASGKNLT